MKLAAVVAEIAIMFGQDSDEAEDAFLYLVEQCGPPSEDDQDVAMAAAMVEAAGSTSH